MSEYDVKVLVTLEQMYTVPADGAGEAAESATARAKEEFRAYDQDLRLQVLTVKQYIGKGAGA